jgi:uridine kinase
MQSFVVGIAGGSGTGKSTLAFGLADAYPHKALVFHIDDYFKPEDKVPSLHGMKNWDTPAALYTDKLVHDLSLLKSGKPVVVSTKSPRLNPEFLKTGQRIPVEFNPAPLIIVEGFLVLYIEALRELLDIAIYLDAPYELRTSRRLHGKLHNFPPEYDDLILKTMHEQYVLPSKERADEVIEVAELSPQEVLEHVTLLLQRTWK